MSGHTAKGEAKGLHQLQFPYGVAVEPGPSGRVYVSDTWNYRILIFAKPRRLFASAASRAQAAARVAAERYHDGRHRSRPPRTQRNFLIKMDEELADNETAGLHAPHLLVQPEAAVAAAVSDAELVSQHALLESLLEEVRRRRQSDDGGGGGGDTVK